MAAGGGTCHTRSALRMAIGKTVPTIFKTGSQKIYQHGTHTTP